MNNKTIFETKFEYWFWFWVWTASFERKKVLQLERIHILWVGFQLLIYFQFHLLLFCFFCFLKDLLFLHQCIYNIIIERTYRKNKLIKHTVKQFTTGKDSYILSYRFQREGSKNLTVFFCSGLTIDLIKYYFRPCKPRNFVFQKGFVCLYLSFENLNRANLYLISYCWLL